MRPCHFSNKHRLEGTRTTFLFRGIVKFKSSSRILNVFSKDIYSIDQPLPRVSLRDYPPPCFSSLRTGIQTIQNTFRTVATCIGIIVVVGIIFPVFLIVVPPLAWFYGRVMAYVTNLPDPNLANLCVAGITSIPPVNSNGWIRSPDHRFSLGSRSPLRAFPRFAPLARRIPS